jgi:hypothetical protein
VLKVLLVVMIFAAVTYASIRLIERRGGQPRRIRPAPRPEARPLGPDDDEDFLRDLDRKRRHPEDPDGTSS